jgi:hypothetical protein
MRGCLFTLLLGAVVVALVVVVGLPQVAAGVLTSAVTAAGLQADDTTVKVTSDPPTDLLGLHADRVRITASDATYRGLRIGALDLLLGDVALVDRSVARVSGTLRDIIVDDVAGGRVHLNEIDVSGGGDTITASTVVAGRDAKSLIADAVEGRTGTRPRSVTLRAPDRLVVDVGLEVGGTLHVTPSGDLVLRLDANPAGVDQVVLLRGGEDLPIRLTDVAVTGSGDLRLGGDLALSILG